MTVTYDWPRVELGGGEGALSAACNHGNVWGVRTCLESPLVQWAPPWHFPPPPKWIQQVAGAEEGLVLRSSLRAQRRGGWGCCCPFLLRCSSSAGTGGAGWRGILLEWRWGLAYSHTPADLARPGPLVAFSGGPSPCSQEQQGGDWWGGGLDFGRGSLVAMLRLSPTFPGSVP